MKKELKKKNIIIKKKEALQWTQCKQYQHKKGNRNYQQGPRGNKEYSFRTEEHSRRNQKQARWSRGSDQWTGGQGRKKHPEWARKGKEAQEEWRGVKGNAGKHETV